MANQTAARLAGDDYQHLFSWHQVLALLRPQTTAERVRLEDEEALSVDDVTVHHSDGHSEYFQVKCHVDHRSGYCESSLTASEESKRSLFQKWYRSFQKLRSLYPGKIPELYLVSNWAWLQEDVLPGFVSGVRETIDEGFFSAKPGSRAGKLKKRLQAHLGVDDRELEAFLRSLRFKVSFGSLKDITERVAERMESLHMKIDEAALHTAAGAVRTWIRNGPTELTADIVRARVTELGLWAPDDVPASVHIHLLTIKDQRFDIEPDYRLDWREFFLGSDKCKGHEGVTSDIWSSRLMPDLLALEEKLNTSTDIRFIRARGKARLSAWTAFGFVFSQVNGYTIEVEQNGNLWTTASIPSADFQLLTNEREGEVVSDRGDAVAVGISITGSLEEDVRRDILQNGSDVRAALLLQPNRQLGTSCLRDGADAMALAQQAKTMMREFVKSYGAKRVLLYYFGPLAGACFLGHQLNAVCPKIQVMERVGEPEREYIPSFLLGA